MTYFKAVDIRGDLLAQARDAENYVSSSVIYYRRYPEEREAYQNELKEILTKYKYSEDNNADFASWGGRGISVSNDKGEKAIYYIDTPELFAYESYDEMPKCQDIGFYSMVKKVDGELLAQYQNFIMIHLIDRSKDSTDPNIDNSKFLLLNDSFTEKTVQKMTKDWLIYNSDLKIEMEGTYDDIYLYPKNLNLYNDMTNERINYVSDKNYKVGKNNIADWIMDKELWIRDPNILGGRYGDYKDGKKLYQEASSLCNVFYKELVTKSNTIDSRYSENLFTSYVGSTGYISEKLAAPYAFVFHPVALAMRDLSAAYFLIAIILIVILAIVNMLIKKLKEQQIRFENNRKELTRSVAHELKTPLGIIKSYTESLKDMSEENKEEYTDVIINEVNHMDKLIQEMLELSRLEAKARTLRFEEVELVSLTQGILKRFDTIIQEQNITLNLVSPKEVIISADLNGIQTVLLNLITNAMKHAVSVITIAIKCDEKSVLFSIDNDGKQITEHQIERIWDTFYKEDKARGHKLGSTGLGLSITKNILELHKAQYGCENIKEGVRFWFKVKLKKQHSCIDSMQ